MNKPPGPASAEIKQIHDATIPDDNDSVTTMFTRGHWCTAYNIIRLAQLNLF